MKNNLNYYITIFFKDYLLNVKGVSSNTVLSYRDTFSYLLKYLKDIEKMNINNLEIDSITDEIIIRFLLYLENERKNSISTRNNRLAAIQSFYNFLKYRELSCLNICNKISAIPIKKAPQNNISYFSKDEISILINSSNTKEKYGFRDYVLLLYMYETASRAQEVCDLKLNQIEFKEDVSYVKILGKGNKTRTVPINQKLTKILIQYINAFEIKDNEFVFKNKNENKLTRKGIEYILLKYIQKVRIYYPDKFKQNYSNHSIRRSKAMHLLESGVNLIYIRDILGHSSVTTTEIYAKANPKIKEEQILQHSNDINAVSKYSQNYKDDLLNFLKTL